MKDPYQYERDNARTRHLPDTFEREPLDFRTEEERNRIDAEIARHRAAELEQARAARRLKLATMEADKRALIKRQERWLAVWHGGLLIGAVIALGLIIRAQF